MYIHEIEDKKIIVNKDLGKMARKSTKVPYKGMKPSNIPDKAWLAVIESWQNGLSDREAAFRASREGDAHILESDIKGWIKKNPDIADLKEHLSADLISSAKLTIAEQLKKGDVKTAKWYLERKAANEFSSKAAIQFEGAVTDLTLEEKDKALKEMWEKFKDE